MRGIPIEFRMEKRCQYFPLLISVKICFSSWELLLVKNDNFSLKIAWLYSLCIDFNCISFTGVCILIKIIKKWRKQLLRTDFIRFWSKVKHLFEQWYVLGGSCKYKGHWWVRCLKFLLKDGKDTVNLKYQQIWFWI